MPVIDNLAGEYADKVVFVAVAWKSSLDKTAAGAASLLPSGDIRWGLDEGEGIFGAYGLLGQPWSVLISASGEEVERWPGIRDPEQIRSSIEALIEA